MSGCSVAEQISPALSSPNDAALAALAASHRLKRRRKERVTHYVLCALSCCVTVAALALFGFKMYLDSQASDDEYTNTTSQR